MDHKNPSCFFLDYYIGGRSLGYSTAIATNAIGIISIGFYLSNSCYK